MNLSLRGNIAFLLSLVVLSTSQTVTVAQTIDGFSAKTSDAERRLEEQLRAVPSPATAREELRILTLKRTSPALPKITPQRFTCAIKCAASDWNQS